MTTTRGYIVVDTEVENHTLAKRKASAFEPKNWIVANGWKTGDDAKPSHWYAATPEEVPEVMLPIPDTVETFVAFNAKFDLLHLWTTPELKAFFKRGGKIWCCQLAEYLLEGQQQHAQMCSLDSIAEGYGGHLKDDEVKTLWESGYLTSQIPKDLLIDYLVGADGSEHDLGDIGNTEKVYLGQLERAERYGIRHVIEERMESLLCTTEMEHNGLFIDVEVTEKNRLELMAEIEALDAKLLEMVKGMSPDGFEFNWGSSRQKSALLFGGSIGYKERGPVLDKEGNVVHKKETEVWPLFDKNPVAYEFTIKCPETGKRYTSKAASQIPVERQLLLRASLTPESASSFAEALLKAQQERPEVLVEQDVFAGGKQKGVPKTKKVTVPGEVKTKLYDKIFRLPRQVEPLDEWEGETTDVAGGAVYSTAGEVMDILETMNDVGELAGILISRTGKSKDLSTYYWVEDDQGKRKGMMTLVGDDNIIHHKLNHNSTVTTRNSSSDPNLQNVATKKKSKVKQGFVSRFGDDGVMIEIDFSQLEVVVQGLLTGDQGMIQDLNEGVDFHCKRVGHVFDITYDEALYLCKNHDAPDHELWANRRGGAKVYSFQV